MMKYARRQLSSELITTVTKLTTPFVRKLNPEILTTFLFPFGFVSRNSSFTLSKYFTWKSSPKILSRSVVKKPNTKINRKDAPTCSKPKKRLNNAISRLPAKPPNKPSFVTPPLEPFGNSFRENSVFTRSF